MVDVLSKHSKRSHDGGMIKHFYPRTCMAEETAGWSLQSSCCAAIGHGQVHAKLRKCVVSLADQSTATTETRRAVLRKPFGRVRMTTILRRIAIESGSALWVASQHRKHNFHGTRKSMHIPIPFPIFHSAHELAQKASWRHGRPRGPLKAAMVGTPSFPRQAKLTDHILSREDFCLFRRISPTNDET